MSTMKRLIAKISLDILLIFFVNFFVYAESTLKIYSCNLFLSNLGIGKLVKSEFEKRYDCKLSFLPFRDEQALLNILKRKEKKFYADIVLGIDSNRVGSFRIKDLFIENRLKNVQFKLPLEEYNKFLIPYNYGYLSFIYDNRKVKKVPNSFDELISEENSWKIIYQDPRTSSSGLGLLFWIKKIYGDGSSKFWKRVAKKTVTVTKGWGESYKLFLKGEGDFLLSYSSSPGHFLIKKNYNYSSAMFKEGHYLQTELVGILSQSRNIRLAEKFIEFILSPKLQRMLSIYNWMYPSIDTELPEVYNSIPEPKKILQFDIQETDQNCQKWVQEWLLALTQW
ncbi:thiamine ABC transporter substrate-binding protein [Candidatus Riesia pediculischaeffi]|uniref:Thiamine-binding periplasmic protein n=1 Tax=Candidatus Riesia pediculischaeffi TaxID=428411 RepID=A0A1V0HKB2_9ENTR|nr:thiamine ABC transporter substrate-binding protein [Candidatus Riesia pediculischaeffi]ARC53268.1 hypothetical protein AOQ87_01025 [Candidatus Riesia pediculischaeffi]